MKLLISACLLGEDVRYDGSNNKIDSELFESILKQHTIYSFCPEVEGGLNTPRPPAEIQKNNSVMTKEGEDVTQAFITGANKALKLCKEHKITLALLKAKSPSCGNIKIYDGCFNSTLKDGMGFTAKVLTDNDIKVFNETQLEELNEFLNHH